MSSALEDTETIIDNVLAQTQSDTDSSSDDTAQTNQEASSADADLL